MNLQINIMWLNLKIIIAKIIYSYPLIFKDRHIKKFVLKYSDYKDCFVSQTPLILHKSLDKAQEVIYIFWTGNNDITENRQAAIDSLVQNSGIEIKLIKPSNLNQYIKKDFPLHPAYEYLSLVHKSDYLRCYFMYHYGGGYSDIKGCTGNWKESFDKLNNSDYYVLGYKEIGAGAIATTNTSIDANLHRYYFKNIGVCAFIHKPNSPIAKEWFDELNSVLDSYYSYLKEHPGNTNGDNAGYPIPWNRILSQILHPILLKYSSKILIDDRVKPIFKNYR